MTPDRQRAVAAAKHLQDAAAIMSDMNADTYMSLIDYLIGNCEYVPTRTDLVNLGRAMREWSRSQREPQP